MTSNPTPLLDAYAAERPRVELFRRFARAGHDSIGQVRKYTGEPYWTHTEATAELYLRIPGISDPEREIGVLALLGHDLLEDVAPKNNAYSLEAIAQQFSVNADTWAGVGFRVLWVVEGLTEHFTREAYPNLNRASRKMLEAGRLWQLGQIDPMLSEILHTAKVCDLVDNTSTISDHDPNFAKVFLREKDVLLNVLDQADPIALEWAKKQVTQALVTV